MMELVNAANAYLNAVPAAERDAALTAMVACDIVSVLAPICPFACEELWHAALGREGSVYTAPWPSSTPPRPRPTRSRSPSRCSARCAPV